MYPAFPFASLTGRGLCMGAALSTNILSLTGQEKNLFFRVKIAGRPLTLRAAIEETSQNEKCSKI
jgi:hypothetical protein